MEIQEYLNEMKNIQLSIRNFLDNDEDDEENFRILTTIFKDQYIHDNKHKLKLLLHMIVEISNNYHRSSNFFSKIEQILLIFKEKITFFYSNWEIFNIFESNKRILLFLIEEKIIVIDEKIIKILNKNKYIYDNYHSFIGPEIKPYINAKNCSRYELVAHLLENLPKDFNEKRKAGENDNPICKIIQNDSIKEFIQCKDKNLNCIIEPTIYETNTLLLKNHTTLIQYAAFFGAIKIFQYLLKNKVELTPSLWLYAIHSNKLEIIQILEENNIKPINRSYKNCIEESLKCHHNDISFYIISNYFQNFDLANIFPFCLKYYNFDFIEEQFINVFSFINLCKFDYYIFVDFLIKNKDININEEIK